MSEPRTEQNMVVVSSEDDGQAQLNKLFQISPLSAERAERLIEQGWESIFTFRPFERSGRADADDTRIALEELNRSGSLTSGDWEFCTAREQKDELERFHHLLRRKTEKRIAWERNNEKQ